MSEVIQTRVGKGIKLAFAKRAKQQGFPTPSAYNRALMTEAATGYPTLDGDMYIVARDLLREIHKLGVNVNQIAKALNRDILPDNADIAERLDECIELYTQALKHYRQLLANAKRRRFVK